MSDRVSGSSACSLRYRVRASYIAVSVQPHPIKNRFGLHVSAVISWSRSLRTEKLWLYEQEALVLVIWMLPALTPSSVCVIPHTDPHSKSSSSFPAPQLQMEMKAGNPERCH